jgi:hypothetical protein
LRRESWLVLTVLLLVLLPLLRLRLLPWRSIIVVRLLGLRPARHRQPRADPQPQQVCAELES